MVLEGVLVLLIDVVSDYTVVDIAGGLQLVLVATAASMVRGHWLCRHSHSSRSLTAPSHHRLKEPLLLQRLLIYLLPITSLARP